jgi:hypothetical protein
VPWPRAADSGTGLCSAPERRSNAVVNFGRRDQLLGGIT